MPGGILKVDGTIIDTLKVDGNIIDIVKLDGALAWQRAFVFEATIDTDQYNYDLYAALVSAGWDEQLEVIATLTNNARLGSTSTNSAALIINALPEDSAVRVINFGSIQGRGGRGAHANGGNGQNGGPAIYLRHPTVIENHHRIWSGGGGGGAGGRAHFEQHSEVFNTDFDTVIECSGGGGGGGCGIDEGNGGNNSGTSFSSDDPVVDYKKVRNATNGGNGDRTSGGGGGKGGRVEVVGDSSRNVIGGSAGNGGGPGQRGENGAKGNVNNLQDASGTSTIQQNGGSGGSPGPTYDGAEFVSYALIGDVR